MFSPIFVEDTKIIFGYNFLASLRLSKSEQRNYFELFFIFNFRAALQTSKKFFLNYTCEC